MESKGALLEAPEGRWYATQEDTVVQPFKEPKSLAENESPSFFSLLSFRFCLLSAFGVHSWRSLNGSGGIIHQVAPEIFSAMAPGHAPTQSSSSKSCYLRTALDPQITGKLNIDGGRDYGHLSWWLVRLRRPKYPVMGHQFTKVGFVYLT